MQWVVTMKPHGIGRAVQIFGPFPDFDAAWDWIHQSNQDAEFVINALEEPK